MSDQTPPVQSQSKQGETEAEGKRVFGLIWDAINDEDWGSIQDVRNLVDEILGLAKGRA